MSIDSRLQLIRVIYPIKLCPAPDAGCHGHKFPACRLHIPFCKLIMLPRNQATVSTCFYLYSNPASASNTSSERSRAFARACTCSMFGRREPLSSLESNPDQYWKIGQTHSMWLPTVFHFNSKHSLFLIHLALVDFRQLYFYWLILAKVQLLVDFSYTF